MISALHCTTDHFDDISLQSDSNGVFKNPVTVSMLPEKRSTYNLLSFEQNLSFLSTRRFK